MHNDMNQDKSTLRQQIDVVDRQIFDLIKKRLDIVRGVAEVKKEQGMPTNDKRREREILTRVTDFLGDDLGEYGRALYRTMFDVSKLYEAQLVCDSYPLYRHIQEQTGLPPQPFPRCATVAVMSSDSDTDSSNATIAAERLFEVPNIMPMQNVDSLAKAVSQGLCRFGLLQIEDSAKGTSAPIYDQLTAYNLSIVRSVRVTTDDRSSYARYICVSRDAVIYPGADRTTIMMVIQNKPGSLFSVLSKLNVIGANLLRLDSRPLASRDFEQGFYFDIESSIYGNKFTSMLCELQDMSEEFHYFGTYSEII